MRPRLYSVMGNPISGHGVAQVTVLEAVGQHAEGEQRGEQCPDPGTAEAQRRGPLPIDDTGR